MSSAAGRGSLTRIIVGSVCRRKKIGMVVPRWSIWGVPRRICFMRGRSMGLRRDSDGFSSLVGLFH